METVGVKIFKIEECMRRKNKFIYQHDARWLHRAASTTSSSGTASARKDFRNKQYPELQPTSPEADYGITRVWRSALAFWCSRSEKRGWHV